jgi:hypothetical protein
MQEIKHWSKGKEKNGAPYSSCGTLGEFLNRLIEQKYIIEQVIIVEYENYNDMEKAHHAIIICHLKE